MGMRVVVGGAALTVPMKDGRRLPMNPGDEIDMDQASDSFRAMVEKQDAWIMRLITVSRGGSEPAQEAAPVPEWPTPEDDLPPATSVSQVDEVPAMPSFGPDGGEGPAGTEDTADSREFTHATTEAEEAARLAQEASEQGQEQEERGATPTEVEEIKLDTDYLSSLNALDMVKEIEALENVEVVRAILAWEEARETVRVTVTRAAEVKIEKLEVNEP